MKEHAFRLTNGQDLKQEILNYAKENEIKAGIILTCVGSLQPAVLRMAGGKAIKTFPDQYEIVSMVGTLSEGDNHLHVSISDIEGRTFGGHLKDGSLVRTTAEVVIGELEELIFTTELDSSTGYKELKVCRNG